MFDQAQHLWVFCQCGASLALTSKAPVLYSFYRPFGANIKGTRSCVSSMDHLELTVKAPALCYRLLEQMIVKSNSRQFNQMQTSRMVAFSSNCQPSKSIIY